MKVRFMFVLMLGIAWFTEVQAQKENLPITHYVLMPAVAMNEISGYFSSASKLRGSWTPSQAELDGLESQLELIATMRSEGPIGGLQSLHPERAYRQYFAVIVGERKVIFVSSFDSDRPPAAYWRTHAVQVSDGGSSVWRVIYDPRTRQFEHLTTNGRA